MYVFKNALRNISRAKGRNFLIFVLVLIIATSACIALSIKSSADKTKSDTLASMNITAQIVMDRSSMISGIRGGSEGMDDIMSMMSETISFGEYQNYATAESVDYYYYTSSLGLNTTEEGIISYSTSSGSSGGFEGKLPSAMGGMTLGMSGGDFSITGYSSHDAMTNFIDGTIVVVEGSMFDIEDTSNSVSISQEIAVLNELEIGDEFTLVNPNDETEIITMTVSSIFLCESTDAYSNDIYMSYNSLQAIAENSKANASTYIEERTGAEMSTELVARDNWVYVLENPDMLTAFESEVISLGLDTERYTVSSPDITQFEQTMLPLDNLSNFTLIFFLVVLGIGAIILIVFNLFTIRERKYEIGVLAAIGMHKTKVATQFLSEVVIVTFAAVMIGSIIGVVASAPIGDMLLQDQIAQASSSGQQIANNFGGSFSGRENGMSMLEGMGFGGSAQVDFVDTIQMSFSFEVLLQLMGIGLILSVVASIIGMISILRFEPLKILSERA